MQQKMKMITRFVMHRVSSTRRMFLLNGVRSRDWPAVRHRRHNFPALFFPDFHFVELELPSSSSPMTP